ncbi:HAD family hydrolase [Nitriliruptoraceae bacterium ZYF776]|nr:HAD family hydrolase [Profundirhabdus halotolerans]
MVEHLVWDWNGTLFDDQHLVVEGLNAVLDDVGVERVDLATYQRLYTRPIQMFYERLFGRSIDVTEWHRIDDVYHRGYRDALHRASLAVDAEAALASAAEAGRTQSLLSMWRHAELVPLVDRLGIADRFVRIDGLRGTGGGVKAPHLEAHLAALVHDAGDDPSRVLVIGDALDDAAAATHVGARCVLYDGGSHPRAELEATGYPVASSLTEAIALGRS